MTSVLTAFRDNTDRVAIAVAECRRLGIEVLPPDIHVSVLHFGVEGPAIRFGLLAVKNVGESALESIIAARESGGDFRSLADFCSRIDLRLVNKRVLESLIKVGAFSRLGHPAQLLLALDEAMAYGQAQQHDRITGQGSLFDAMSEEAVTLERPLSPTTEAPARERLRWEKELLGLYLSAHPLGELAAEIAQYVNAYSGDLGEELDQQRIVVGGVVTATRRVITKARATMAVATLEDLQGSLEVVIFPKVFEETGPTWAEERILLVAGRVDHKGEETVLLAEGVWTWEDAIALGPQAFGHAVSQVGGRRGGRSGGYSNGNGGGWSNGRPQASGPGAGGRPPVAIPVEVNGPTALPVSGGQSAFASGAGVSSVSTPAQVVRTIPNVSPLRGIVLEGTREVVIGGKGATAPALVPPSEPRGDSLEPASLDALGRDNSDEPPWPDEAAAKLVRETEAETSAVEAAGGQTLHIRFQPAPQEQVVESFRALRELIHARPGETPVVLHIPAGGGREQRMELRTGVAYDAELLAEVGRRLGQGLVALHLD